MGLAALGYVLADGLGGVGGGWRMPVVCWGLGRGDDPAAVCGGDSAAFKYLLTSKAAFSIVLRLSVFLLCSEWCRRGKRRQWPALMDGGERSGVVDGAGWNTEGAKEDRQKRQMGCGWAAKGQNGVQTVRGWGAAGFGAKRAIGPQGGGGGSGKRAGRFAGGVGGFQHMLP